MFITLSEYLTAGVNTAMYSRSDLAGLTRPDDAFQAISPTGGSHYFRKRRWA